MLGEGDTGPQGWSPHTFLAVLLTQPVSEATGRGEEGPLHADSISGAQHEACRQLAVPPRTASPETLPAPVPKGRCPGRETPSPPDSWRLLSAPGREENVRNSEPSLRFAEQMWSLALEAKTPPTELLCYFHQLILKAGVSSPWAAGRLRPRMAVNVAQHKVVNVLKTL